MIAGTQGYSVYRIPSFAVANDGALMLFAEGRPNGSDPGGAGDIDLVYKRSIDGGKTWSDLSTLHSTANFDYSDPRVVVDRDSGQVHLQYIQWPTHCGQTCVPAGLGDNSSVVYYQTSDNHGTTWSVPANLNSQVKSPTWASLNTGPGLGIQLKWQDDHPARNGRLLIPAHRRPSGYEGVALYSDDGGVTWTHGSGATPGFTDESEVIELTNGDLLWDGRQSSGTRRRRYISHDGGDTWTEPHNGDIAITTVDGALVRYSARRDGDDRDRILFSGPLGSPLGAGNSRNNIGIWTSYDEGKSFINPVQIQSGSAAYSVIDKLNDGSIGLVYEVSHNTIRYANLPLAELERGIHPPSMSHYDGFGNQVDAFRGGVGWSGAWQNSEVRIDPGTLEFSGFHTQSDGQHARLRGNDMTRDLGNGAIDLNKNQDYYVSLFVNHDGADGEDSSSQELLQFRLLEDAEQRFEFGVTSDEAFVVRNQNAATSVVAPAESLETETTYLLLAKIAAQDDSRADNFDQLLLAWYHDPSQVPQDESQINWQLVGQTSDNFNGAIDEIFISAGANVDWRVDGLRIGTEFGAVIVDTGIAPPAILGDLNGDRLVDLADWVAFKENFGLDTSSLSEEERAKVGDFDLSGRIGAEDFVAFRDRFRAVEGSLASTEILTSVPEPCSLSLLIVGWIVMPRRRGKKYLSRTSNANRFQTCTDRVVCAG